MLDKLVELGTPPAGLAALLIGIYQDSNQDVVMRDYAIQHIAPFYAKAQPEEKSLLSEALWNAVGEISNSIGGTALLALEELASDNPEFSRGKVSDAAFRSAVNSQSSELVRITAIQICARMGITQATEVILELAQNSPSVPLRMSALAALGDLGDRNSQALLEQAAVGPEERLRVTAESALKRLKQRVKD
jgi:hypothetical protein